MDERCYSGLLATMQSKPISPFFCSGFTFSLSVAYEFRRVINGEIQSHSGHVINGETGRNIVLLMVLWTIMSRTKVICIILALDEGEWFAAFNGSVARRKRAPSIHWIGSCVRLMLV